MVLSKNSGWSGDCKIYSLVEDPAEPVLKTQLIGHAYQVYDIQFHPLFSKGLLGPDSPNIATSGADTTVKLWTYNPEAAVQDCLDLIGHSDRVNRVRWHPMGAHIFSSSHDRTVKFWDIGKFLL